LALSQRLTQLGRQRASRSVAPQLVSVRPDLNVAAAQLLKKGHHVHKANSSRSPAGPLVIGAFATHDSLSIISASPATVGRSKRLRSDRSTSNSSRIRDTALMAINDWPAKSKKSSLMPTFCTLSRSVQIAASVFSVSVSV